MGCILAALQAILYSTMGIFGKLLYATGLGPEQVVLLRFFFSAVLLGVFLLAWRKQRLISRQPSVYVQAVFFFASALFYFLAVNRLTAGMTTVIFYSYPAMVAIGSSVFLREKFTAATAVALLLAMVGLVLVAGPLGGEVQLDPLGVGEAIVSCASFAIYTLLIHKTARTDGPLTVTFTLSLCSLVAGCVVFAGHIPALAGISVTQIGLSCGLALASTIIPIVLYIEAVKRIGATKSSLIGVCETPSSLLLAFLILGETITLNQGVGSLFIVASILVITIPPLLKK